MALNGKIAVVTGGAQGIGKAMTEILLQNGAKVVMLDVNEPTGKSSKEALDKKYGQENTVFLLCDVQSEDHIKAALQKTVETFGGIDILCNNAGILNENEWEKTVSINLLGVIRVTYQALNHMNKLNGGRGGVIVNTASVAGLGPVLCSPVYTAAKHGVIGFTRTMAAVSAASGYGIRINSICPGSVKTELIANSTDHFGQFGTKKLVDLTTEMMREFGIITTSLAAECLLELVTDETKNGETLMVTVKGKKYLTFPAFSECYQS